MADQPPMVPPFRKPVSEFKSPDQTVIFVTELVNRDDPAYVANAPVKRGTLYKDVIGGSQLLGDQYPLLYFCGERKFQLNDQYVFWDWSSVELADDSYNANITYELEVAGYPVFTRISSVRRDEYEQNPTLTIGQPLQALIGITISDGGTNYTQASGFIQDKEATVEFVCSGGQIISGVVTNEGVGILSTDTIIVTGDGVGARIIPMVQPTSAVLISQKKDELPTDNPYASEFVQVTRVYETLPGPTIHSTELQVDGGVVDVATTVKVASTITSGETLVGTTWTETTKKQSDNGYTGEEIVRTRTVPGNLVPYTSLDEDGVTKTGKRTLKDTTLITTSETLITGVWTKTNKEYLTTRLSIGEEASDLVSWEVVESRPIPGNNIVEDTIDDRDGAIQVVVRTMESIATITAINPKEYIDTGTYVKVESKYISDLVAWKIVTARKVPGNNVVEESVDDRDGAIQSVTRVLVDASTITPSESIVGGVTYRKVEAKPVTDILSWKVTTDRPVPGNDVVKTELDADGDKITETRTIVIGPPTLVTSITTSGGVYTKTFGEPINDLISWKVVQVKATQNTLPSYEVEIPDLIPSIFTGLLPITTTESTVIGTASQPTLATGDLMRRQAQMGFNTYRLTIRGRANLSLPQSVVVSRQLTEEYGGEQVKTTGYLNSSEPAVESGLGIISSTVKNLGNGTYFRETEEWDTATSWPILTEYDQDPETQALITTTYQVIDASTVSAPSIVNGQITRYKKIDKWRSLEIIEVYSLPDSYDEQRFMAHPFPSLWDFTTYNYSTACGPTGPIRQGFASMVQARLTISFTTSKDTIVGLVIQPNTIRLVHDVINAVLNDAGTLTYIGTCSGPITFPASSPDFTTYTTTIQGTEQLISGESVLWRAGLYKNSRLYVTML